MIYTVLSLKSANELASFDYLADAIAWVWAVAEGEDDLSELENWAVCEYDGRNLRRTFEVAA